MSVTAPAGFRAAGVTAGIKESGQPDVAVVINDGPSHAAAGVFTANRVKAAPVLWTGQVIKGGRVRAVVLTWGGASACTGRAGFGDTHHTAERLATVLSVSAGEIAVCSTGLIGERLPMARLLPAVDAGAATAWTGGGSAGAGAIRTTDTGAKMCRGPGPGDEIGGMAQGARTLAPARAPMPPGRTTRAEPGAEGALRPRIRGRAPELGRRHGRRGAHGGYLRARPAQRGDQRDLGLPERVGGRGQVPRRPEAPGRDHNRRPRCGPALGHDPHHRPDRGVRARELGLLDVTAMTSPEAGPAGTGPAGEAGRGAGGGPAARPAQMTAEAKAGALVKAATLIEALPWLEQFHGETVVIKFGGHAMADEALCFAFAQDVVFLRYAGLRPVGVHGGGPQISEHLRPLGIPSTFAAGLRVTTPETMDVGRMVLTGHANRDVVGHINRHGPVALGVSG